MKITPDKRDDGVYDPPGTSALFEELWCCAEMLVGNFDEQIVGAPADYLEEWRDYAVAVGHSIAFIQSELGLTT